MRFYRGFRGKPLQNDSKKGQFIYRQNVLQTFYCDKREFTRISLIRLA